MPFSKFLDPKNDYAFKRIFGTERNKDILIHFLNDMLTFKGNAKIQDVSFLKPVQDPDLAAKKQSIVDVLCRDEKNRQYIVEMQVAKIEGFEKRAQYYAAKAYVGQMNQGEQYRNLKEVIFLAITDFVMFPTKAAYKSDHIILDGKSFEHDLKDFSFTFLELPKFTLTIDELTSMEEKWAYFFKHANETTDKELEKIAADDFVLRKAYEELDKCYWSEEELLTYEQELKSQRDAQAILNAAKQEGRAEGIVEGRMKGRAEAEITIAKKMLAQGMTIKMIAQVTGLTESEIHKIS